MPRISILAVSMALGHAGCSTEPVCGPATAVVARVLDGDTIELSSGERIRYLLVDTPELERDGAATDCFATEAAQLNRDLVLGREITLRYGSQCTDRFGRLLAYVSVDHVEINALIIERGYGCVLYIPPNGSERVSELEVLEASARAAGRGMWSMCMPVTCQ